MFAEAGKRDDNNKDDISLLISSLFMELASEARFSLLVSLNSKPAKLSTLARETNITVKEVYRNLNRLIEEGLAEKQVDSLFHITEYGMIVLNQIPYFSFIKRYKDYFKSHSLTKSNIPSKYLRRIGELEKCETINSVTAVLQTLKKLESSANESLKVMVAQAWPEEGQIFINRAQEHGVRISVLRGCNTIFPKNVIEEILPATRRLISKGTFEPRLLEKVNIAIYLADNKYAGIMFPYKNNNNNNNNTDEVVVDMNALFVSKDPIFCEWCSDVFEHFWLLGKPDYDAKDIKVVDL